MHIPSMTTWSVSLRTRTVVMMTNIEKTNVQMGSANLYSSPSCNNKTANEISRLNTTIWNFLVHWYQRSVDLKLLPISAIINIMDILLGVTEWDGGLKDSLDWIGQCTKHVQSTYVMFIYRYTYTSIIFLKDFPSWDAASQLYYTEVTSMSA